MPTQIISFETLFLLTNYQLNGTTILYRCWIAPHCIALYILNHTQDTANKQRGIATGCLSVSAVSSRAHHSCCVTPVHRATRQHTCPRTESTLQKNEMCVSFSVSLKFPTRLFHIYIQVSILQSESKTHECPHDKAQQRITEGSLWFLFWFKNACLPIPTSPGEWMREKRFTRALKVAIVTLSVTLSIQS